MEAAVSERSHKKNLHILSIVLYKSLAKVDNEPNLNMTKSQYIFRNRNMLFKSYLSVV